MCEFKKVARLTPFAGCDTFSEINLTGMQESMIEKLLEIQRHDIRIRDMEKEIQDIPVRKKKEESVLSKWQQTVTDQEEA